MGIRPYGFKNSASTESCLFLPKTGRLNALREQDNLERDCDEDSGLLTCIFVQSRICKRIAKTSEPFPSLSIAASAT